MKIAFLWNTSESLGKGLESHQSAFVEAGEEGHILLLVECCIINATLALHFKISKKEK